MRNTRFCSPQVRFVWKPTRLYALRSAFSGRSWTTAHGRLPVLGSMSPTGFMAPKRTESMPVRATSSTGWQAQNRSFCSKSRATTRSAPSSSVMNASYSALSMGQFR